MTATTFLILFGFYSAANALITEAVKKLISDKAPNLIALITALITGCGGTAAYYLFHQIPFTVNSIAAAVLMGLAVAVGSMVGYDKVTQAIEQLMGK